VGLGGADQVVAGLLGGAARDRRVAGGLVAEDLGGGLGLAAQRVGVTAGLGGHRVGVLLRLAPDEQRLLVGLAADALGLRAALDGELVRLGLGLFTQLGGGGLGVAEQLAHDVPDLLHQLLATRGGGDGLGDLVALGPRLQQLGAERLETLLGVGALGVAGGAGAVQLVLEAGEVGRPALELLVPALELLLDQRELFVEPAALALDELQLLGVGRRSLGGRRGDGGRRRGLGVAQGLSEAGSLCEGALKRRGRCLEQRIDLLGLIATTDDRELRPAQHHGREFCLRLALEFGRRRHVFGEFVHVGGQWQVLIRIDRLPI